MLLDEVTTIRVPLSAEAEEVLIYQARMNRMSIKNTVEQLLDQHCWWIMQLYERPFSYSSPYYKAQKTVHRARMRTAKDLVAHRAKTKISISFEHKAKLLDTRKVTGLPMGAILSLAIMAAEDSFKTKRDKGCVKRIQRSCLGQIISKRRQIMAEVREMEESWEMLLLTHVESETSLGYRMLLSFFSSFHELENLGK